MRSRKGAMSLGLLVVCIGALLNGACRSWSDWGPAGYVLDIGDAKEITRWTLNQTELSRVGDGAYTLANLIADSDINESVVAASGYVAVVKKLEVGWPDLTLKLSDGSYTSPPRNAPAGERSVTGEIQALYGVAAWVAVSSHERHRDEVSARAFDSLRSVEPSGGYPELKSLWRRQIDWAQSRINPSATSPK